MDIDRRRKKTGIQNRLTKYRCGLKPELEFGFCRRYSYGTAFGLSPVRKQYLGVAVRLDGRKLL